MRWIVRVARTMDDVQECYFTDKNKALNEFHRQGAKYGGSKCHEVKLKEISNG